MLCDWKTNTKRFRHRFGLKLDAPQNEFKARQETDINDKTEHQRINIKLNKLYSVKYTMIEQGNN